jgi:hypothetical protein
MGQPRPLEHTFQLHIASLNFGQQERRHKVLDNLMQAGRRRAKRGAFIHGWHGDNTLQQNPPHNIPIPFSSHKDY